MSFEKQINVPLDYQSVSYPGSMAEFRGPAGDLTQRQIVCLGGTETFGRFVPHPFVQTASVVLGRPAINLGAMNSGLEMMLHDAAVDEAVSNAEHVVLQVTGAHLMTNRFYRVHPRRNDRFLRASSTLSTVFRGTDFTEFHFVRHMLSVLQNDSAERFEIVVRELQEAWVARMKSFISNVNAPLHLLWISLRPPSDDKPVLDAGIDPLFITKSMLEEVAATAQSLSICIATPEELELPAEGMRYAPRELSAAKVLPGPAQHDRAADMLAKVISS